MTPYEYLDIANGNLSHTTALVSLAIAVLSGYVVVAYSVGDKLTRTQVFALNTSYIIWSSYLLLSGGLNLRSAFDNWAIGYEMLGKPWGTIPAGVYVFYGVGFIVFSTSLWFMWSVRHPKTE